MISICGRHDLVYKNPKEFTHTHAHTHSTELVSKFSKVAGYKNNMQKSVLFLYTHNKQSKNEIKKTIPLTIAPKTIEHLGIDLAKEVQGLYPGN